VSLAAIVNLIAPTHSPRVSASDLNPIAAVILRASPSPTIRWPPFASPAAVAHLSARSAPTSLQCC